MTENIKVLKDLTVNARIYYSHFYRKQNQSTKMEEPVLWALMKNAQVAGSQDVQESSA